MLSVVQQFNNKIDEKEVKVDTMIEAATSGSSTQDCQMNTPTECTLLKVHDLYLDVYFYISACHGVRWPEAVKRSTIDESKKKLAEVKKESKETLDAIKAANIIVSPKVECFIVLQRYIV